MGKKEQDFIEVNVPVEKAFDSGQTPSIHVDTMASILLSWDVIRMAFVEERFNLDCTEREHHVTHRMIMSHKNFKRFVKQLNEIDKNLDEQLESLNEK